jgi:hypothetical protein
MPEGYNRAMRKAWSMLLLLAFVLPMAAQAMAAGLDSDGGLPACCRRTGAHHCTMAAPAGDSWAPVFRAPKECCPYCPATVATAGHAEAWSVPQPATVWAGMRAYAAGVPQAESLWRVARERARGKRGPPELLS